MHRKSGSAGDQHQSTLVSVIVPAYNAETHIRRTIESALDQTHTNLEILVADDGSTDTTCSIVTEVARQDSRITLLQQANAGVAAARNLAIKHSTGQYIAPLDADDLWFPEKIEKQVRRMEESGPEVGLVYTSSVHIDEDTEEVIGADPLWCIEGRILPRLIYRNFTGNASVPLIKRTCLDKVGGYNSQLRQQGGEGCEDWDLLLRIAEHFEFRAIPEHLVRYRAVSGSMSRNSAAMGKSHELVLKSLRQRHPEISSSVFRWGRARFYLYLAGRSYKTNPRQCLYWSACALCNDPMTIFLPWFRTIFARSLAWVVLNPVNSAHRYQLKRQQWHKAQQVLSRQSHPPSTEEQRVANVGDKVYTREVAWDADNYYDRIIIRRFWRVAKDG
jgi:glycosyltransferase involved in cell wall biosynthesis